MIKIARNRIYAFIKLVLVQIGRWIGPFFFYHKKYQVFLFFPFYHIGGAEKVHSEIVSFVKGLQPIVFFTKQSKDAKFRHLFNRHAYCVDISPYLKRSWTSYIVFGIISNTINKAVNPIVFGSNSNFFYHLLPYLKSHTYCIDLIHAFGGGIENVSLPYIEHLVKRIVVSEKVKDDLIHQYISKGISGGYVSRIKVIENGVSVKEQYPKKGTDDCLVAIFVGRGSEEKRIDLIGKAASKIKEAGIPAKLIFIGDVVDYIGKADRVNCIFKGEISDDKMLSDYYEQADLMILTSSREGFPLVIMEGMAHGVVPICTDVGGISHHIVNLENGILITAKNPADIVNSLVEIISQLHFNRARLKIMSVAAFEYAKTFFNSRDCASSYQKLFYSGKAKVT